jgi:hypothetical protein
VLASRVTDLGGGTWHYEYALYNMNSDRSIASVSVPVNPAVIVSNIGFHDVAYLAGDGEGGVNRDGTDWPGVNAAGAVSWATTPFATNNNANALRFHTTYNIPLRRERGPPSRARSRWASTKVVNSVVVSNVDVPGDPPGAFTASARTARWARTTRRLPVRQHRRGRQRLRAQLRSQRREPVGHRDALARTTSC